MDRTSNLSLETMLKSYNILIAFLVFFIFIVLLLLVLNPKGFNKAFGNEVFITGPMLLLIAYLIKETILYNSNPQESIFNSFASPYFLYIMILSIIGLSILTFFLMLYVAGIFSDNPPKNNTSVLINFFIIISFFIILLVVYNRSKTKDDLLLQSLPTNIKQMFELRTKYTLLFIFFAFILTLLYFFNPYEIMTKYGGPVIFMSIFIGMTFLVMIGIYHNYLSDISPNNLLYNTPTFLSFFIKGFYILFSLFLSGLIIYGLLKSMGVFNQDATKTNNLGSIFFNLLVFTAMLGIIYKLANAGGFLDKNPLYRLILNTMLYIPCLFVSFINYASAIIGLIPKQPGGAFTPPKPFEIKMLLLSLVLLGGYFLWTLLIKQYIISKYLKQGGKQLLNAPVSTNKLTTIPTDELIFIDNKFNYQYAMSFWFYLDSFPLNTNASYLKNVNIFSFNNLPMIKYNPSLNTLFVTMSSDDKLTNKNNIDTSNLKDDVNIGSSWNDIKTQIEKVKNMHIQYEEDNDGNKIIYKDSNVLLQKWNQVVLNYNGGTLDIFYNGKLVKSAIEIVPYMKLDMINIGTDNGVSGNVANLLYFKQPLDLLTINTLYTSLKDKNPPSI